MDTSGAAKQLVETLRLERPPIAVTFVESRPEGIAPYEGSAVPSACSFWPKAEAGVFYASAEQHYNCPIGAMTMGFDIPEDVKENLMQIVGHMCDQQYIDSEEPGSMPIAQQNKGGIVYGPLSDFPLAPDVVLVWLPAAESAVYNEAAGGARWSESPTNSVLGRPTCSALPVALLRSQATMSLGCIGMHVFTGVASDRLLGAIPASELQQFLDALATADRANAVMADFYKAHKAQFA